MSKRPKLEDKLSAKEPKEKEECNRYHRVSEEPGDRDELMQCYDCGWLFSRDMAIEYGLKYAVDPQ